jgi:hypothetical protein
MPSKKSAPVTASPLKLVKAIVVPAILGTLKLIGSVVLVGVSSTLTAINPENLGLTAGDGLKLYTTDVVDSVIFAVSMQGIPLRFVLLNIKLVAIMKAPPKLN